MFVGKRFVLRGTQAILAVAFMATLVAFDDCSPTERPCNEPGSCEPESQLPACIRHCVPRLQREEALGQVCVTDPCDDRLVGTGEAILCPGTLTCWPTSDGLGVCTDVLGGVMSPCDVSGTINTCATGLYCKNFESETCPDGVQRPTAGTFYDGWDGLCAPPVREGGICDGNWGSGTCLECEPGTFCVPDPNRNDTLRCLRECATDEDCPRCTEEGGPRCQTTGHCSVCVSHGSECIYRDPNPEMDELCANDPFAPGCPEWLGQQPYECCDPDDQCQSIGRPASDEYAGLFTGQCCRVEGGSCETDDDCCGTHLCDPTTNTCEPCNTLGEPENLGCCPGLENRGDDICRPECIETPGTSCTRSDCPGVEMVWRCDDVQGDVCEPVEALPPQDTTCDGINDDCDMAIDEDAGGESCSFTDSRCEGFEVPGVTVCRGGANVCEPIDPYCVYEFGDMPAGGVLREGPVVDCFAVEPLDTLPIDCGVGGHSDCPPVMYCTSRPGITPSGLGCWEMNRSLPGETEPEVSCQPGFVCWKPRTDTTPGDHNTTGTSCP